MTNEQLKVLIVLLLNMLIAAGKEIENNLAAVGLKNTGVNGPYYPVLEPLYNLKREVESILVLLGAKK